MIEIDITVKSKKWLKIEGVEGFLQKMCNKLIKLTEIDNILTETLNLEIAISLVSDLQIQKINKEFRNKDKATDILSFPALDPEIIKSKGLKKAINSCNYIFLGDIVISHDTLKRESVEQKKDFKDHLTHLILHSILHLIAYDHKNKDDAKIMEDMEIKILNKIGINNPYIC